jgi:hypothetical protein
MKRINLTENDIFNIVNKVIAEQSTKKTPKVLSPEDLRKRFLNGDKTTLPKVPAIKGMTFPIKDKRGLRKELFDFIVEDVEFKQTDKGATALVKGYIKGQEGSITELTVFEYVCGRFGDFVLKEYEGLDENDVKKQKTPKVKSDSEGNFKSNVKQGINNTKQNLKQNLQGVKQRFQNDKGDI